MPRDDALLADWSFEAVIPSETDPLSWLKKTTLLEETTSDDAGVSLDGSGSGIGAARRRLMRSMKPPPAVAPCVSIFGASAAGTG
jgi:hypothetical protein